MGISVFQGCVLFVVSQLGMICIPLSNNSVREPWSMYRGP